MDDGPERMTSPSMCVVRASAGSSRTRRTLTAWCDAASKTLVMGDERRSSRKVQSREVWNDGASRGERRFLWYQKPGR